MTATVIVVVIVVVVVLLALAAGAVLVRGRRTRRLRRQFGPEYDRVLAQSENRRDAESTLEARRERHDELELHRLDPATRDRYRSDWLQVQRSFVDDPGAAVERADDLVTAIMRDHGYPVEDFEQRAADVSVSHPEVVEHYRQARQVRDAHRHGTAGTEDLRSAVTSYRDLVDALLDDGGHDETAREPRQDRSRR